MQIDSSNIEKLVQQIITLVSPLKIIFFGSASKAQIDNQNDIDLLVVIPEGSHRRKTAQLLYNKIFGSAVPFDILEATPDDLEKYKDNIGLIYRTILKEGREIYAV